jgi:hypothetical protein
MNSAEESSRRMRYISFSVMLILALSIASMAVSRPTSAAGSALSGVVVPLYYAPDSSWTTVAQTAKANPNVPIIAVINPSNGPGSASDPTYLAGVQSLQSSGVTVLGFVATSYGASPTDNVETQIRHYHYWYNVNGIFFNQVSNTTGSESYYTTLNSYVKSHGMTFTMGDAGTSVPPSYFGILDNLILYEDSGYPSLSSITHSGYPESDFGLVAYGVPYDGTFVSNAASLAGYMYIDDLSGASRYSTLSSLFVQTVDTLSTIDPAASTTTSSSSSSSSSTSSSTSTSSTTSSTRTTTSTTTTTSTRPPTASLSISTVDSGNHSLSGFTIQALVDTTTGQTLHSGSHTPRTYSVPLGHSYSLTIDDNGTYNVVSANVGTFARTSANGGGGTATFTLMGNTNIVFTVSPSTTTTTSTSTSSTTTSVSSSSTTSTTTTTTSHSTTSTSTTSSATSSTTSAASPPSTTTITVTSVATSITTLIPSTTTRTTSSTTAPSASSPTSGTPSGRLVQLRLVDIFGMPISGAQVALTAKGGKVLNGVTDSNGTVTYDNVPQGMVNATYSYLGVSGHVQNVTQGQHPETVTVALSYPIISVGAVGGGTAAISGVVAWRRHRSIVGVVKK